MREHSTPRREAAPLACTLSLALLAVWAAPGISENTAGTAAPAGTSQTSGTAKASGTAKVVAPATSPTAVTKTTAAKTTVAKKTVAKKTAAGTPSPKDAAAGSAGVSAASGTKGQNGEGSADYTLRGGQEGTVFKSLTVEGEDRVHVDFERPELKIDLDLEKAPGLDWGSAADVLNRSNSDLNAPLVALSAKQMTPYLARPWLSEFATGPVARFHPQAEGVERWKLVVVNSKGAPVASFSGKGDPPREIAWDGRAANGAPVTPGLTYSYVFEAYDRAGNKRNVVGQGFTVTAYRIDAPEGPTLLFSATELHSAAGAQIAPAASEGSGPPPAPILLEAASWLNQSERLTRPIRVTAIARSQEQAGLLAGSVVRALAPLVLGDSERLEAVAVVEPDAPEAGTLSIAPGK